MGDEIEIPGDFYSEEYHLLCLCSLLVDFFLYFTVPSTSENIFPVDQHKHFIPFCIFHVPKHNRFLSCFFLLSAKSQQNFYLFLLKNVL